MLSDQILSHRLECALVKFASSQQQPSSSSSNLLVTVAANAVCERGATVRDLITLASQQPLRPPTVSPSSLIRLFYSCEQKLFVTYYYVYIHSISIHYVTSYTVSKNPCITRVSH